MERNDNQANPPNLPNLETLIEIAKSWDVRYITFKEFWERHCKNIGLKFRLWAKNFKFYKIEIADDGTVNKTYIATYKDIEECKMHHTSYEILQFFLNYVCDLKTLNDLR